MAKRISATKQARLNKVKTDYAMSKAKVAAVKQKTQAAKLAAKASYKMKKAKARNFAPLEKEKIRAQIAKHTVWASTAGSIFGRGTAAAESLAKNSSATSSQNVNGGLQNTTSSRDDDEEKDTVEGGGVVY